MEEELLGLLASFQDGGGGGGGDSRELSFSDLVEAGASRPGADQCAAAAGRGGGGGASTGTTTTSSGKHEAAATTTRQQQRQREHAAARHRTRRSGGGGGSSRGSCGGSGDGVLLNLYVPGLLTRSMTAPRPGRGAVSLPPTAGQGAPAKAAAAAGKTRAPSPPSIGCWPAFWGRRDRRSPAKACSS